MFTIRIRPTHNTSDFELTIINLNKIFVSKKMLKFVLNLDEEVNAKFSNSHGKNKRKQK
jgi:hypothetical protein